MVWDYMFLCGEVWSAICCVVSDTVAVWLSRSGYWQLKSWIIAWMFMQSFSITAVNIHTALQVRKVASVAINVILRNWGRASRAIVSLTKRK